MTDLQVTVKDNKAIWTEYYERYGKKYFTFNVCKVFRLDGNIVLDEPAIYATDTYRCKSHMTESSAMRVHNFLSSKLSSHSMDMWMLMVHGIDQRLKKQREYNNHYDTFAKSNGKYHKSFGVINKKDGDIPWLFSLPAGNFSADYIVYVSERHDNNEYGVIQTVADTKPELIQLDEKDLQKYLEDNRVNYAGNNGIPVDCDLQWSASPIEEIRWNEYKYNVGYDGTYSVEFDHMIHHNHYVEVLGG